MATKKEIKEWLDESRYTKEQMDKFWEELAETNWKVKNLSMSGKTWSDMNISVIKTIPTQKERDLKVKEIRELEEKEKLEEQKKLEEDKRYYQEHFEEIMVKKIDSNEGLNEKELERIVRNYEIETEEGDSERWTKYMYTICELCGRYFAINWQSGLTEMQEDEYDEQPYEVKVHEYEKTITVREWISIDKKG